MKDNNGQIWLKNRHPTQYTDTAKRTNKNPTKNYDRNGKTFFIVHVKVNSKQWKHAYRASKAPRNRTFRTTDSDRHRKIMNFYINLKNLFHSNKIWSTRFLLFFSCYVRWFGSSFNWIPLVWALSLVYFSLVSFSRSLSSDFIQHWVGKIVCEMKNLIYRMNLSFIRRLISW